MFKHICYIILYMSRTPNRNLSNNDMNMLDFYTQQYNDTYYRINQLQRSLERINENINRIYFGEHHNTNSSRNRNNSRNRHTDANSYLFEPAPSRSSRPLREDYTTNILNQPDTRWTNFMSSFFSNVSVFATVEEIRRATTVLRYGDIVNPLNESCPISLERFTEDSNVIQLNYCGHLFNTNELNIWFENNVRCPVCRHDIRLTRQSNISSPSSPEHNVTQPEAIVSSSDTFTTELITRLTDQLIDSLYNENTDTIDGNRILYDASNNTFMFEAYIPLYRENS